MKPKDRTLVVRMTAEDYAELERVAANERATVSDYVRHAMLSYMALRGSRHAWKAVGASLLAILQERYGTEVTLAEVRSHR